MKCCKNTPFLNCGGVCENTLPNELTQNDKPINLAWVKVDTENMGTPHILINYSQNLQFQIEDFNPKFSIVYRLIRKADHKRGTLVLESWNYKVEEVIPTIVQTINTIEPLVLNFCDGLDDNFDNSFTYILQVVEIITENTSFNITDQEISAIVSCGN